MSYYVDSSVGSPTTFSTPRPAMLVSDELFPASFPDLPSLYTFLPTPGDSQKPGIQLWTSWESCNVRFSTFCTNIKEKFRTPGSGGGSFSGRDSS